MPALLLSLLLSAAPTPAAPTMDVLGDVNAVRNNICAVGSGKRAPLELNDRLNTAAARVAHGADPHDALVAAGYSARRTASIHLQGYETDAQLRQALARTNCALIGDPEFHDVGIGWNTDHVWIVLAVERGVPGDAVSVSARVLRLVNEARAQPRRCGAQNFRAAGPLTLNAQLERAALAHSQDMAENSYMEHEGRDGSTPAQRVTRAGYRWFEVGENVAAGQDTPEAVMASWLASAGHCANIMNATFTEMGIASAVNARDNYGVYWTMSLAAPR